MKHRLGTQRFVAMRVEDDEDRLPTKEHTTYRSAARTLLYWTNHSR